MRMINRLIIRDAYDRRAKTMLQLLKLLLPALIPSWRFFDTVAPSPRIEYSLLKTSQEIHGSWQQFRPRPAQLSIISMLKRLFWNPRWNESLFLTSCAERLIANPTEHSREEIVRRIKADLTIDTIATPYLQFRLVFWTRNDHQLEQHILYISPPYLLRGTVS